MVKMAPLAILQCFLLGFALSPSSVAADSGIQAPTRVEVRVDPEKIVKVVTENPLGINLDYLMDGDAHPFQIPLHDQISSIGARVLRYPGGNKSDSYLWSVAPWEKADPHGFITGAWPFHPEWGKPWFEPGGRCRDLVLDFDEFMATLKRVGGEAHLVVPYDEIYRHPKSVDGPYPVEFVVRNAEEWVRYANVKKRWGIRYWEIGNEVWLGTNGPGAERYRRDVVAFSRRMKAVDPTIRILVNGDKREWFETLLGSADAIDGLTRSIYPLWDVKDQYEGYRRRKGSLTEKDVAPMRKALASCRVPGAVDRIQLFVSEHNAIDFAKPGWTNRCDLGKSLAAFQIAAELYSAPDVAHACFWNTRWIGTNRPHSDSANDAFHPTGKPTPMGLALSMLGNHRLPAVLAPVSSSPSLLAFAAMDKGTRRLNFFLLNKDLDPVTCDLSVEGHPDLTIEAHLVYTGRNPTDMAPEIKKQPLPMKTPVSIPGLSISVLQVRL